MRKLLFTSTVLILISQLLLGQEQKWAYSRWDLQAAIGYNFSSNKLEAGEITDYLIDYDFNNLYLQGISGSFYLFKNFGAEITMQASYRSTESQQEIDFQTTLESIYGDQYFVTSNLNFYTSTNTLTGDFPTYYYGLVFRFQRNKLQWKAKLMLSSITINKHSGSATLKEKGTNNVMELRYHTYSDSPPENIFSPSIYMAYRIHKMFLIHLNFVYSYADINFSYLEKITDLATDQSQSRIIPYSTKLKKYSLGFGITMELGSIKSKQSPASP